MKMFGKTVSFIFLWAVLVWNLPVVDTLLAQSMLSFRNARRDFEAGSGPLSIANGDFNGDGIQDLAVANVRSGTVSVLLGNGDGTFGSAQKFEAGTGPTSATVGDFNGDKVPDLAVTNVGTSSDPDTVSILLGNGDGTFRLPRSYGVGRGPVSIAVGDFNGDKVPDLVVANNGRPDTPGNSVSILIGNGDGTFRSARDFGVGVRPQSVAVADFNGDELPDLAVANFGSGNVSILLGNGDGTFRSARDFGVGFGGARSVAVGDFDGDKIQDLALAGESSSTVLLGNGDGTFGPAEDFRLVRIGGRSVIVGDFNGDQIPDLAVANEGFSGSVSIVLGDGYGKFGRARNFEVGATPWSVIAGDFDGDGIQDLAVANANSDTVSILIGNGDGTFRSAPRFEVGLQPSSVAVGDFNGDEIQDLAVVNLGICCTSSTVSILLGTGNGRFRSARNVAVGHMPRSVAVGDFNGDEIQDLAVLNQGGAFGTVSILLGKGNGTFQSARNFVVGAGSWSIAVGDFNGDDRLDLAVANRSSGDVSVLIGHGDGTFGPAQNYRTEHEPIQVMVGDVNGDKIPDLVVGNFNNYILGSVSILIGNGDGTFESPRSFAIGDRLGPLTLGDFNGDEILDLAVTNTLHFTVSILLGNGDGTFGPAREFRLRDSPVSIIVGDFNADGIQDLAVAARSNTVYVLLGNGDGAFQLPLGFGAGIGPTAVTLGDFNGDRIPDLAVTNAILTDSLSPSTVSILINDSQ